MKISKIIENCTIILFFLVVIAYPITAYFSGVENNLSGADKKVEFSLETLDDYIIQNFPGRELLVRTKNQFLYKFLDVSPNASITKLDDTLFSTETLNYYYHGLHKADDKFITDTITKLKYLNEKLNSKGKQLLVITTPTKPRYYDGDLPFADDVILAYQGNLGRKSYEIFRERIERTNINYFDCIKYIDNHKDKMLGDEVPLFYKSGHHWSNYKGNLIGLALMDYIRKNMKFKIAHMHINPKKTDKAVYPDSDLFDVLNIYDKPNEQFYESEIIYDDFDMEEKNYLIQGGSFLGGLLFPSISLGLNNKTYHIENKSCLYDHYVKEVTFEDYDDLDRQVDLLNNLKDMDVFILEINELNVYNATFGFLDYLLEHEDKL